MKDVYDNKIPFLFYDLDPRKEIEYDEDGDEINDYILNIPVLLQLFTNINHITIETNKWNKFNLQSLLSLIIDSGKTNIKYHIKAKRGMRNRNTWLCSIDIPFVLSSHKDKQWNIKYERTGYKGCDDSILIHCNK